MTSDSQKKSDRLLTAVQRTDARTWAGRLRIFLGMSAGVGKTYAMLKAAQERMREGTDVIVGLVETHGRPDTEQLLAGLRMAPRHAISYKGASLEELDIDWILHRRPQLVLIDELAHTNAPGSRHPKRWQDIVEILDAGIDVYSTINVQHIESRKESVEAITGITIRESVPDSILERAAQIILIDITPAELLKRLAEGKVYLGDRAQAALDGFFKEDRLTALREIALRLTAETVDNELQDLIAGQESRGVWKPTERLMVAVSHSPYSEGLIRATRRLAFSLDAPWIAVNVDTGVSLSTDDRAVLSRNMSLVRDLGGEIVTTPDTDIASALKRIARQRGVTQLIIGRPTRRFIRDAIRRGTLADRLVTEAVPFDVHVLRPEEKPHSETRGAPEQGTTTDWNAYGIVTAVIVGVALVSSLALPFIGYRAVGFFFLLAVLGIGLNASIGPIMLAAALSALVWDFFFIPPPYTFYIYELSDVVMCIAYFVAAATTGTLTHRIRHRERLIRRRENQTQVLYDVVRALVSRPDRMDAMRAAAKRLGEVLNAECWVVPVTLSGDLDRSAMLALDPVNDDKEWAVAQWAFQQRRAAGWSTDTLLGANAMYVPLIGPSTTVGVLATHSKNGTRLLSEEEDLLMAVAQQMAIALEREVLHQRAIETERLRESERLHQTIIDSVSHELRTPLTGIIGAASALRDERIAASTETRKKLAEELVNNAQRLNRVVANLLDMSRLSSGVLRLSRDWHDVNDLIALAIDSNQHALTGRGISCEIPDSLPLVRVDFHLFEQAIGNLLVNAATYTPAGTAIQLKGEVKGDQLAISVIDAGRGIPEDSLPHLFDRFYRVPGTAPSGTGTGLAIVKAVVELHGGRVDARNRPEGGANFTITLPIEPQPEMPREAGNS
jgi:two-component system sensor histidine kinase KdpD